MGKTMEYLRVAFLCGLTLLLVLLFAPIALLVDVLIAIVLGGIAGFIRSKHRRLPSQDALALLFLGLTRPWKAIAQRNTQGESDA